MTRGTCEAHEESATTDRIKYSVKLSSVYIRGLFLVRRRGIRSLHLIVAEEKKRTRQSPYYLLRHKRSCMRRQARRTSSLAENFIFQMHKMLSSYVSDTSGKSFFPFLFFLFCDPNHFDRR